MKTWYGNVINETNINTEILLCAFVRKHLKVVIKIVIEMLWGSTMLGIGDITDWERERER